MALAPLMFVAACAMNPHPNKKVASAKQSPADGIGCLDTLHAADSVSMIVKMSIASQDPKVALPRDFEDLFVEEFRSRFKLPSKLPLSVVMGSEPCDSLGSRCVGGILSVGAVAYVTVHNDGKLSDIAVVDIALTPRLADSVKSALQSMSRAELAPPIGDVDPIPLMLQIVQEEKPDTVPEVRHVFQAKVPKYDRPFSYASMPAVGIDAKYPFNARALLASRTA